MAYLDEKTNLKEELVIISKIPFKINLNTIFSNYIDFLLSINPVVVALSFTFASILLFSFDISSLVWWVLGLFFTSFGLSHGAVDYLTDSNVSSSKDLTIFICTYLFKGACFAALWYIQPDLALVGFILFSAWHFGQTDFNEWKLTQTIFSFLWGLSVTGIILFFHFSETLDVLRHIPGLTSISNIESLQTHINKYLKILPTAFAFLIAFKFKSKNMLLTVTYLLISSYLPLLISFGIYFIFQHSFQGWNHLKTQLKISNSDMFTKAAPYTFTAIIFISLALINYRSNSLGIFFIILSCISMPHVLSMNHFYKKK